MERKIIGPSQGGCIGVCVGMNAKLFLVLLNENFWATLNFPAIALPVQQHLTAACKSPLTIPAVKIILCESRWDWVCACGLWDRLLLFSFIATGVWDINENFKTPYWGEKKSVSKINIEVNHQRVLAGTNRNRGSCEMDTREWRD